MNIQQIKDTDKAWNSLVTDSNRAHHDPATINRDVHNSKSDPQLNLLPASRNSWHRSSIHHVFLGVNNTEKAQPTWHREENKETERDEDDEGEHQEAVPSPKRGHGEIHYGHVPPSLTRATSTPSPRAKRPLPAAPTVPHRFRHGSRRCVGTARDIWQFSRTGPPTAHSNTQRCD